MALPFDLRRYRGVGLVLGSLALVLIGVDLGLRASLGDRVAEVHDFNAIDWSTYELFGSQVGGVERERLLHPERDRPFGVLLGTSSTLWGPLPELVEAETKQPWLLLGVGGGPWTYRKVQRSLPVLERARLEPNLILFGLHPFWLCQQRPPPKPPQALEMSAVSERVYDRLQDARESFTLQLGAGSWSAFTPAQDPWHPAPIKLRDAPRSPAGIADHVGLSEEQGRFDVANYSPSSAEERALQEVVESLIAMSDRVVIALMPEHSTFRVRVPALGEERTRAVLAKFGGRVVILDLREAIPDAEFYDSVHLTTKGRGRLSRVLAERLAPNLPRED
ncbi:MAG: hypothetical protein JKY65_02425 [Planctomycetes bacterium]|nr:hypothetical protein [Planctomycetota bacterium]